MLLLICGLDWYECIQERYWRISGQLSSADLRRSAAALQAEPPPSLQQETDDGHEGADSSHDDVTMDTAENVTMDTADDVDNEMTTLRRHDSLKAKKRALLAALAQKRLESDTANSKRLESPSDSANNKRFVFFLQ